MADGKAMQHQQYNDTANDNIEDYVMPINKSLDCMWFIHKQQFYILVQISQSAYFSIHFHLLLE
jgi:hypothetical protein